MSPESRRQIVFINAAHSLTHYSLLILPTAVLAMAVPGGAFGTDYGRILERAPGMFVLYGLFSLPQGWLAARLGRKALMTAFFLGTLALPRRGRVGGLAAPAGAHPGGGRAVRRNLPPDRHRHAGGGGGGPPRGGRSA
jgi:hypothetical protein